MPHKEDCVFCQIAIGKAPRHLVWEDDDHVAFLSLRPNTDGVTVVIPREHWTSYAFDLPDDVLSGLTLAARTVAKLLDRKLPTVARTGMVFEGYGIDHVHAKLYPMHGTGSDSSFRPISSNVDKFFDRYEGYISSHDWKRAPDDELASIASRIRE